MESSDAPTPVSPVELAGPATLLRRLGLRAQKGLSQSFLTDRGVARAMAEAAELEPADEVLEIGPGLGILTNALLAQAGRVVAVELDRHLAERLPGLLSDKRLEVVHDDALRFDPADHFETDYKLVANLPYQITSPVLHRYLVQVRRPAALVLMVQREVAERIAAGPGKANFLAVLVQAVAEIRLVRRIPASAFYPRPRVDSAVMLLRPRSNPAVSQTSLPDLLRLVRAGFTQPRKTTVNSLAQGLDLPRGEVESALTAAGIEPRSRPQQLSLTDWLTLLRSGALSQRTRDERSRLSNRESE